MTCSLAITASLMGQTTLLIDGDQRRPWLAAPKTLGQSVGERRAEPITVSIVISTYNARDVLADCLTSICKNAPCESYEIIIVDVASTDGTRDMVRARFPRVHLL